ncbi:lytic polysaccharide monooxygenase [Providencia rettgeri]|nr:lytic polysaccharide monooxygenase [Providencia rettgeri]MBN7840391.1 lytic polysaccharide monooxygenase [Providencia rettgeri]MBN7852975.1 lytic polysaccharide monooxygenase [Providencia rettgeri]MBN7861815.1 lytic polysaccharide monooxygenase [Providencia rettgeri]MBN7874806.1 lytic polysaccharide monooxygenase [Providencia rettgeri]
MKPFLIAPLLLCCSSFVWSHGYVESPESRSYYCKQGVNTHCGAVQYEPQSIEGQKGFPQYGPVDGKIASAGIAAFSPLDIQTANRWQRVILNSPDVRFKWRITAKHKTTKWEYFITKPDWQSNALLSRNQFTLTPFCKFERVEFPEETVEHKCVLPKNQKGYHVILAIWTIDDTQNAFYQVIDAEIN